ncbi:Stk1 family PASTA domain-containing Ser/Thr kinase [Massilioclostridium coli]|uniref:Stk1 family PASTA domain-containing Ser/Thr kinase n=1 Tax=Massilioclostridium coli TaxID=1870991 RepID=UPI00085BE741|nr:Stk1 family PASTA domain-containing Ser/Thr kinase [Massilioclostridium coli]
MDKFIGKRLDGRYEFKELIGMGGMANVYKAFDIVDQKYVAIKILKEEYQGNEEFLRRFRNESKAVAALSHPNIVRIFDVNFGDRIQYIVMELIDGITLKEFMEKVGVLSWKDAVLFTVQILRALQHAHDKGIVHRDIKPQNIMLLEDGTIKVMDFGIARFARDEKRNTEQAIGSVHYISPEQASGEVTDEKSDLYSVGVMLYEMLTGKLPFDGETPEEVAVKQMQAIAPAPRSINPDIPEGLEEIIVRAMQKNPNKRYQSAAEMLRDIDEFKRNPSIVFEYKYFDEGTTKYFNVAQKDEEQEEEEETKKSKFLPILLGVSITFVVIAAILITLMLVLKQPAPEDVVVQDFTGMNYHDVQNMEEYKKIDFKIVSEYNSEYTEDLIFDQEPDPDIKIKENGKITLYVSKGSQQVKVPDVSGLDIDAAVARLKEEGFTGSINKVKKEDSSVPANCVISTDPKAGTKVDPKQAITVYYSYGQSNTVYVQDVVGKDQGSARSALESQGLKVNIHTVKSDKPAGTVISQDPRGGNTVAVGATITLTVSDGTGVVTSSAPESSQTPSSSQPESSAPSSSEIEDESSTPNNSSSNDNISSRNRYGTWSRD